MDNSNKKQSADSQATQGSQSQTHTEERAYFILLHDLGCSRNKLLKCMCT